MFLVIISSSYAVAFSIAILSIYCFFIFPEFEVLRSIILKLVSGFNIDSEMILPRIISYNSINVPVSYAFSGYRSWIFVRTL